MAMTQLSDMIVPDVFARYSQQYTMQKTPFVNRGIMRSSPYLSEQLAKGSDTFNLPSFDDLGNTAARVSTTAAPALYGGPAAPVPEGIKAFKEIAVRMSRNMSWGSAALTSELIGEDPMAAIINRTAAYWSRQLQQVAISTIKGIFADNDAAPSAGEHVAKDLTVDIKGTTFVDGTTNISASKVLDALQTMGDASEELGIIVLHSAVLTNLKKKNLIDFIPAARGEVGFNTFLERQIVVSDSMPKNGNVYETWILGPGALLFGESRAEGDVTLPWNDEAGNGGGGRFLYNRKTWCVHPVGHKFIGSPAADGGPTNTEIEAAGSWQRVYPERKQIKIARLITREA